MTQLWISKAPLCNHTLFTSLVFNAPVGRCVGNMNDILQWQTPSMPIRNSPKAVYFLIYTCIVSNGEIDYFNTGLSEMYPTPIRSPCRKKKYKNYREALFCRTTQSYNCPSVSEVYDINSQPIHIRYKLFRHNCCLMKYTIWVWGSLQLLFIHNHNNVLHLSMSDMHWVTIFDIL